MKVVIVLILIILEVLYEYGNNKYLQNGSVS